MSDYRITVIMGIYNCASTLEEALDSLMAQTYQDFKVILCDDGSQDDTYAVAKSYSERYNNILILRNEKNMGLNYTLNRCLDLADTEYCARMDGDDVCDPTRFEKEINFLDSHSEYAFVTSQMHYFDSKGVFMTGHGEGETELSDYPKHTPYNHAPCMVRTYAYKMVGGYTVDKKLLRQEDYHLWLKMKNNGFRGYTLPEPLYSMRDDNKAYERRNWKSRRNEAYVKYLACRMLHLPFYNYIFCLKPIIIYLLPSKVYCYLHSHR